MSDQSDYIAATWAEAQLPCEPWPQERADTVPDAPTPRAAITKGDVLAFVFTLGIFGLVLAVMAVAL
jgi:hypothetical protein